MQFVIPCLGDPLRNLYLPLQSKFPQRKERICFDYDHITSSLSQRADTQQEPHKYLLNKLIQMPVQNSQDVKTFNNSCQIIVS